jgi:glycosyltransferase involved in cell wall biosynthesis
MKTWAHTLVKNEERYVWFAIMSVINYVDKILLWDTGSTDSTFQILQQIKKQYPDKVELEQVGDVNPEEYTGIRQKMLEKTKGDWVFIVDGDEVWWDDTIKKLITTVSENKVIESLVTRYYNLIGDIYHRQEEAAGMYKIDGEKGHLTIRAMSMSVPGLHLERPHGTQGFFDDDGVLIQERDVSKRVHIKEHGYLHFTNLPRSSSRTEDLKVPKRGQKLKHEIGIPLPLDFYYPEVFFRPRPDIVPSPWVKMSDTYKHKALVQTPLRKVKRRLFYGKVGY